MVLQRCFKCMGFGHHGRECIVGGGGGGGGRGGGGRGGGSGFNSGFGGIGRGDNRDMGYNEMYMMKYVTMSISRLLTQIIACITV